MFLAGRPPLSRRGPTASRLAPFEHRPHNYGAHSCVPPWQGRRSAVQSDAPDKVDVAGLRHSLVAGAQLVTTRTRSDGVLPLALEVALCTRHTGVRTVFGISRQQLAGTTASSSPSEGRTAAKGEFTV